MPVLTFKTPPWVLLVGFPLLLTPASPSTLFSPGSPLTDDEYEVFFSSLRPSWKASLVCQVRRIKGCQYPKIIHLDQVENRGQIPEGPVCTELSQRPLFESFCEFTQFRCLHEDFYAKRIPCPKLSLAEETDVLPTTKNEIHVLAPNEASPLFPDQLLQSNIDSILKYSFAVSGQEPVLKNDFQAAHNHTETPQFPEWPDYFNTEILTSPSETFTSVIESVEKKKKTDPHSPPEVSISVIKNVDERENTEHHPLPEASTTIIKNFDERENTEHPPPPEVSISIIKNVEEGENTDQFSSPEVSTAMIKNDEERENADHLSSHEVSIPIIDIVEDKENTHQLSPHEVSIPIFKNVEDKENAHQLSSHELSISLIKKVEDKKNTDQLSPLELATSVIKNVEDKENTDQNLIHHINHLIGTELSLKKTFKVEGMHAAEDKKPEVNIQEDITKSSSAGSLLAISKDEAVMILCYAVLQDICVSSAISKLWKEIEGRIFGSETLVCDSLGRHHADLCADCAFCSLKTEQCQGASDLKRVPCSDGTFTYYINPDIIVQHQAMHPESSSHQEEFFGFETYKGISRETWCSHLAADGCGDNRVALWLQAEYSFFRGGDDPDQICDSEGVLHPTYCAFKSNQCMQYTLGNKVSRTGCLTSRIYKKLSPKEGEAEVLLWTQNSSKPESE